MNVEKHNCMEAKTKGIVIAVKPNATPRTLVWPCFHTQTTCIPIRVTHMTSHQPSINQAGETIVRIPTVLIPTILILIPIILILILGILASSSSSSPPSS